jgi:biotin carboxyl carrier protein
MKNKIIAGVAVVAVVGSGAWLLNSKGQRHAHEMGPTLLPVVVEAKLLTTGHTRLTLPVVADVQALRDTVVSSRLSAYVTALPLFEGGRFKRGQLLARLDMTPGGIQGQNNSLETEVAAAESTLITEQERLRRAKALYEIQGIAQEQLQAAEASFAAARSRHTIAKENLRGATITAPFDGVVSQRLAQPGDLVTPGKPVLKITDTSAGNRLLVNVPEAVQPVGLRIGDQMLPLTPWPEAGPQGLRRFEARGKDGGLLPGSRVDAKLVVFRSPEAVLLPSRCLLNDDGHTATVLALKDAGATKDPASQMPAQPSGHHAEQSQEHQPALKAEHAPEHQPEPAHRMHGEQAPVDAGAPVAPAGGHHHKPQTAGEIETISVKIAAHGEEGSVASDASLSGRRILCGSPDVLSRLVAGAPFSLQADKE